MMDPSFSNTIFLFFYLISNCNKRHGYNYCKWVSWVQLLRCDIFRGVVPGCAMAHPDFGRSVNLISNRGTDYAHLITTGTPRFSNLPTALLFRDNWQLIFGTPIILHNRRKIMFVLKFIYSEKTTKFCKIFTLLLSYV